MAGAAPASGYPAPIMIEDALISSSAAGIEAGPVAYREKAEQW